MALSPQLLQFKSSGVYRLEFDKSITANINVETLRLVVGHSRKGPYNSPVLVSTVEEFQTVFGSIDRKLEKKGMFFHRSAQEALSRGPILALNVAEFNSDADSADHDKGYFVKPSTNGSSESAAKVAGDKVYTKYFDMDKFMVPSDSRVLDILDTEGDSDNLINFVNIKQNPITIIIRKAQDVKEFDITARNWYGEGNVPEYLHELDLLSDYMVDIFVFRGDFSNAAADPVYGAYFSAEGLDKSKLEEFANLREVTLEAQYTGSLLPGFKDLEGRNLYVETMVNTEARKTGLFCAINEDEVMHYDAANKEYSKVDLIGHDYTNGGVQSELLSYKLGTGDRAVMLMLSNSDWATKIGTSIQIEIPAADLPANFEESLPSVGDYITAESGRVAKVNSVSKSIIDGTARAGTFQVGDVKVAEVLATQQNIDDGDLGADGNVVTALTDIMVEEVLYTQADVDADYVSANLFRWILSTAEEVNAPIVNPAGGEVIPYLKSWENTTDRYVAFTLKAADLNDMTISKCLAGLKGGTGIHAALTDKDLIDFRYVIDTFSSFDSSLQNKAELASLAKDRQNASAILNAPMVSDFKKSNDPQFVDVDGVFKTNYIATGGNLDLNPSYTYSLPGITAGANYAFYYGPGLVVSDNGKDLIVPPAAYVSNNFIDKFTNATPWSIVAGPRRGVVNGSNVKGVEYSFDKADRDVLEPFGINPIVFQRGVGLTILGNKTAQQSVKSALSSAHVREALIYIQEGMANILKDYVFEFNNTQTRLEIKTLADSFLEGVKADGGVYEFKNVMDQTNNTDNVIDNNIGIIDTYVEPVKGLEIVVHRTTILNTGEISTGNFN